MNEITNLRIRELESDPFDLSKMISLNKKVNSDSDLSDQTIKILDI